MDKHNFRSYVTAVDCNDEYDDGVTHVAIELRPSAIARLILISLVARLLRSILKWAGLYALEASFDKTTWLNHEPDGEEVFSEEWEDDAIVDAVDPSLFADRQLVMEHVSVSGSYGWLNFSCYSKHSGTEYYSHEVTLKELTRAIRWCDVIGELREWSDKLRFAGGTPCPEN